LNEDIPRVYVGTKSDQSRPSKENLGDDDWRPSSVIDEAAVHCQELDLEPPLVTSASESMLGAEDDVGIEERRIALEHLSRCFLTEEVERLRSKPHEEKKRREASRRRNRKMMWFGVGVGVAVAVVGYLWIGATSKSPEGAERKDRLGWLRSWFSSPLPSTTTTTAESTN
jgi:hypothetical protein